MGVDEGIVVERDHLESTRNDPPAIALLVVFAAVAVALTYPSLGHFGSRIPGDAGDSLLNVWILRTVQIGLPHGWHALWNTRIFFPHTDTLAYSETLLPVALVHWPLRTVVGDVAALNAIALSSWVLSAWAMYRLARRFVTHWGAALIGALVYTYSANRMVHSADVQLVVGGALVPLALLTLLQCLERPSPRTGITFGITFAVLLLTSSYYGAMTGIFVVVVVVGWAWAAPKPAIRSARIPFGLAAGVVVILAGPFAIHYLVLQHSSSFRRGFDPTSAAHLSDFLRTGYGNPVLSHLPLIGPRSCQTVAGLENRLFPGVIAVVFGAMGALAWVRRARRGEPARELASIVVAGAIVLVLSFGDWFTVAGRRIPLPFVVLRHGVPGFTGIRANARLVLGSELALALVAAIGVDAVLRKCHGRAARVSLTVVVAACVIAESLITVNFVQVPTGSDNGGLEQVLASAPPGAVLEFPIESTKSGVAWPYVEAPRQLLALPDGHPRVNGYSGFEPPHFEHVADLLNFFPAQPALDEAHRLGVHYVVLRTRLASTSMPVSVRRLLIADGVGRYTVAHARAIIAALPPTAAAHVTQVAGGFVIALGP